MRCNRFRAKGNDMADADPNLLSGKWVHSHDEGERQVFRPAGYKLPPARGRTAMEFGHGGEWTDLPISPRDGNERRPGGKWQLQPGGVLHLSAADAEGEARKVRIVALEKDRLVIEPC